MRDCGTCVFTPVDTNLHFLPKYGYNVSYVSILGLLGAAAPSRLDGSKDQYRVERHEPGHRRYHLCLTGCWRCLWCYRRGQSANNTQSKTYPTPTPDSVNIQQSQRLRRPPPPLRCGAAAASTSSTSPGRDDDESKICRFVYITDQHSKILGYRVLNSQLSLWIGLLQLIVCCWALAQHIYAILFHKTILYCDFDNATITNENPFLVGVDAIIFDVGLFHSLWGIHGCVAQHLDGGYGRFAWCICHIAVLLFCLPFAFVSRPKPYFLWPLLIQQSAYGIGLLILSLAALPRILPTFMGEFKNAPIAAILFYVFGALMNYLLLYVYYHWYWHVESEFESATKLHHNRLSEDDDGDPRKRPFKPPPVPILPPDDDIFGSFNGRLSVAQLQSNGHVVTKVRGLDGPCTGSDSSVVSSRLPPALAAAKVNGFLTNGITPPNGVLNSHRLSVTSGFSCGSLDVTPTAVLPNHASRTSLASNTSTQIVSNRPPPSMVCSEYDNVPSPMRNVNGNGNGNGNGHVRKMQYSIEDDEERSFGTPPMCPSPYRGTPQAAFSPPQAAFYGNGNGHLPQAYAHLYHPQQSRSAAGTPTPGTPQMSHSRNYANKYRLAQGMSNGHIYATAI